MMSTCVLQSAACLRDVDVVIEKEREGQEQKEEMLARCQ